MTDWSKLKVVDLREECKSRDIPLTGLKLKQQYVDKLIEYEAQTATTSEPDHADPVESNPNGEAKSLEKEMAEDIPEKQGDTAEIATLPVSQGEDYHVEEAPKNEGEPATQEQGPAVNDTEGQEADAPAEKIEGGVSGLVEHDVKHGVGSGIPPTDEKPASPDRVVADLKRITPPTLKSAHAPSSSSTLSTPQIAPAELAEDQRLRRKRSATPIPSAEEVSRKKARLSQEVEEPKRVEDLEQTREPTDAAKENRIEAANGHPAEVTTEEPADTTAPVEPLPPVPEAVAPPLNASKQGMSSSLSRSRSPSEERDIPPAIHPATCSLYISRLKRPLQPQSFRSHIISKATSRPSHESDPITSFYLDSIKTHAFVSFTSVAAASRVRAAMHGVRFPDENAREPLFVDYVPDDKIQSWIDQETESSFGRGGGNRRLFEVVYEEGEGSTQAIFQEVDTAKPRPPIEPSRSSRMSLDKPPAEQVPAGVHPDRAALVPRDRDSRDSDRDRLQRVGAKNVDVNPGRGFKELDELFNSTQTKPKLYYKPVSEFVAAERLDMLRNLHVGHNEMGRSGDEGMKRFSFERSHDRDEWVDKGPEFGYGRKGQERLAGGGDRMGRGRRGGYRGRPIDSWRGR